MEMGGGLLIWGRLLDGLLGSWTGLIAGEAECFCSSFLSRSTSRVQRVVEVWVGEEERIDEDDQPH